MTTHPPRRPRLVALALLLGAATVVAPMVAQATPPAPAISVVAAPNPVGQNDTSTLTVTVDPGLAGETVSLELKVAGLLWSLVDTATLDADSTARFAVKQGLLGSYQYRAKVVANANHTAGTSAVSTLSVVASATPVAVPGVYGCAGASPASSIAHPGGGAWQCTFNDEFSGTALDTTYWNVAAQGLMTQPKTEKACFGDQSTGNVAVGGGTLKLTASVKAAATACPGHPTKSSRKFGATVWHNSPDGTEPTLQQTFGYYEVRAQLPGLHGGTEGRAVAPPATPAYPTDTAKGLQETFYLWPTTDRYGFWPLSGEMDFAEFYSAAGNLDAPAMHQLSGTTTGGWKSPGCNIDPATGGTVGGFNTYKFLWTSTRLTTWVNDNPTPCTDLAISGGPFNKGFYLILMQAFGNAETLNEYTLTPGAVPDVGTTEIDYVRIWQ
ncbi:glycoside hydrolase family 16 protein [Nocardioides sp. LML1-1-1.1]|uniref:glycoside hydrolase family 16 protein n=1 Tax=Nocardioides sp. LML1-1-1.1 TaxID=3135248 RepID=UPI003417B95D